MFGCREILSLYPEDRQLEPGDTLDREAMLIAGKDGELTQELYALILEYIAHDDFEKYDRISYLLQEHMNSPYVTMEEGKFLKKKIKRVPERKFRPWMFNIRPGIDGERQLLEDALRSIAEMETHAENDEVKGMLAERKVEYEERLEGL